MLFIQGFEYTDLPPFFPQNFTVDWIFGDKKQKKKKLPTDLRSRHLKANIEQKRF